jgi:hypothetical protein
MITKLFKKFVFKNFGQSKLFSQQARIEKLWNDIEKDIKGINVVKKVEKEKDCVILGENLNDSKLVYYVPLTEGDYGLLNYFSEKAKESIKKGGRIVLKNEIENLKFQNNIYIQFDFIPLGESEIKEMEVLFPHILKDKTTYIFALQMGKSFLNLLKMYQQKNRILINSTIFHYNNISIPFSNITLEFNKQPDSHYINLLFKNKLDEESLCKELKNIYFEFYNSLVSGKLDILKGIETNMIERSKVLLANLKINDLSLSWSKDSLDIDECYIFDKLLVKGVYHERNKNKQANDYILINTQEFKGIRYYMHKYFTGYAIKYRNDRDFFTTMLRTNENNEYSISQKEANRNIILRVTLVIKHPYRLVVNNDEQKTSYSHLAVFENELISPYPAYLPDYNFEEWISRHQLADKWKLVDVDNFMQGNSFFDDNFDNHTIEPKLWNLLKANLPMLRFEENKPLPVEIKKKSKVNELSGTYRIKNVFDKDIDISGLATVLSSLKNQVN